MGISTTNFENGMSQFEEEIEQLENIRHRQDRQIKYHYQFWIFELDNEPNSIKPGS